LSANLKKTFNAQQVYDKLTKHHLKSTKAKIESSTILSYVTSTRLGPGEWSGSTEGFITHWLNQVRLYESQVPASDHFSDGQKGFMLEKAVSNISELRQVKNNADIEQTRSGSTLAFDQYLNLLLSAATAYDNPFANRKPTQSILLYDIQEHDEEDYDNETYYIDAPITTILANAN
jgi:hypothetical protein